MMTLEAFTQILLMLLVVIPPMVINYYYNIKQNRNIVISMIRMIVQLSFVGLYLQFLYDLNNYIVNIIYMLLMILIASLNIIKTVELPRNKVLKHVVTSMVIPNFLLVVYFISVMESPSNALDAKYLITISGMLLGNVLSGDIIGLNTYYKGIKDNKKIINYKLSLGATRSQATKDYFSEAISNTIKPTISSIATIGLVSIPGMMTGQLLGGSVPITAITYQIGIMITIFVVRYLNVFLTILLTQNALFNKQDQLML